MNLLTLNGFEIKNIFEKITDGFYVVDNDWIVRAWNKSAEKILGIKKDEVLGENIWTIFEPEVTLQFFSEYHRALEQNVPVCFKEYYAPLEKWLQVTAYPSGNLLMVMFRILSNDKCKIGQIESYEDKYRYLFNNNLFSIVIWGLVDLRIMDINETALELFGFTRTESLNKTIFDLIPKQEYGQINELVKNAVRKAEFTSVERMKHFKKNGEVLIMEFTFTKIDFNGKQAIMAMGSNITEKVQMASSLKQQSKLKQKVITEAVIMAVENQRASIGKALHENVNQILGAVKLNLDFARSDQHNRDRLLEASTDYLKSAIEEISKLSRSLDASEINDLRLKDGIITLAKDFSRDFMIKVKCTFKNLRDSMLSKNLKLNFFRIVEQQLSNIIQHAKANSISIHIVQLQNEISLKIIDDGIGFDVSKEANGTGIKNIIGRSELYDGEISIVSFPGKGSELNIVFPLNKDYLLS